MTDEKLLVERPLIPAFGEQFPMTLSPKSRQLAAMAKAAEKEGFEYVGEWNLPGEEVGLFRLIQLQTEYGWYGHDSVNELRELLQAQGRTPKSHWLATFMQTFSPKGNICIFAAFDVMWGIKHIGGIIFPVTMRNFLNPSAEVWEQEWRKVTDPIPRTTVWLIQDE